MSRYSQYFILPIASHENQSENYLKTSQKKEVDVIALVIAIIFWWFILVLKKDYFLKFIYTICCVIFYRCWQKCNNTRTKKWRKTSWTKSKTHYQWLGRLWCSQIGKFKTCNRSKNFWKTNTNVLRKLKKYTHIRR